MKLVLANNQTERFKAFHKEVQKDEELYDYSGYNSLLFIFENEGEKRTDFLNTQTGRHSYEYEGVYINGYLNTPDVALAVATILDNNGVNYVNKELSNGLSLSKLSAYAKLAAAGVTIPKTYGGFKGVILSSLDKYIQMKYPAILKRTDADRGIDNYKVESSDEVRELLTDKDESSVWVLQDFIPNDGFYLVSFYYNEPKFSIFRTLEERPDGNKRLAHMYKPKGGSNATLVNLSDLDESIMRESVKAVKAMNRQFASVDSVFVEETGTTYVLEVNYNPQLVTIETFKDVRREAFIEAIEKLGR